MSTARTKILLDGGINLEENEVLPNLQAQYGFSDIRAAFLSHYSTNYMAFSLEKVPVYAGKLAGKITAAADVYKAKKPCDFAGFYDNGMAITVGDITVTPYLVDDAVHDGYLLLIEGDEKKVMYTGDFRANGRRSFEDMLKGLPKKVDVLICEHGVIAKEDVNLVTERDLEEQAAALIGDTKGPVFLLQAVTDFDRAATMFHAAKRNKRVFLEDLYMSRLACAADEAMPNPSGWVGVKVYLTAGYQEDHFRYRMFTELPRLSKSEMGTQKFVMCIRPSMKKYMKSLFQSRMLTNGTLINTLSAERWNSTATQEFLTFAKGKGLKIVTLRNSGHADAMALKALVETVRPAKIVPMTVQHFHWLRNEYPMTAIVTQDELTC
jgi:ribonuclease J